MKKYLLTCILMVTLLSEAHLSGFKSHKKFAAARRTKKQDEVPLPEIFEHYPDLMREYKFKLQDNCMTQ